MLHDASSMLMDRLIKCLKKSYEKQGNNMKPQSFTVFDVELRRNEGFSVFSQRISFI